MADPGAFRGRCHGYDGDVRVVPSEEVGGGMDVEAADHRPPRSATKTALSGWPAWIAAIIGGTVCDTDSAVRQRGSPKSAKRAVSAESVAHHPPGGRPHRDVERVH